MSTLKVTNIQSNGSGFNDVVSFQNSVGTQNGTLCRAWVNFNGALAGTRPFTSSGGIRASFNVSSITYLSEGTYRINFSNSLPDANYSAVAAGGLNNLNNVAEVTIPSNEPPTTTSVCVHTQWGGSPIVENLTTIYVSIFR